MLPNACPKPKSKPKVRVSLPKSKPKRNRLSSLATKNTYHGMISRCYYPGNASYTNYGGRGIKVCDRWLASRTNFVEDMGERPLGHVIDRIDNDGDYEPSNCRWVTRSQNRLNRPDVRWFEYQGERRCLREWSRITGISTTVLRKRVKRGLPFELAVALGNNRMGHTRLTHCKRGHPFTGTNVIELSRGGRACRACQKLYRAQRAT